MYRLLTLVALVTLLAALPAAARAQNPGQADLDMATELQLTAETLGELEKVIKLAESALEKGLDNEQTEFAKKMLAATYFQHANRHADSVFERSPPAPQWPLIRREALKDLAKARQYDPALPDIYLLEAKFQALPGGDKKAALEAADEAVRLLGGKDEPKQLAQAYLLRAELTDEVEKKLADFEAAVKADPKNVQALQGRALLYLQKGENEKAVAELKRLVDEDTDNAALMAVLADALTNLKKYDEALKYCDAVIQHAPRATLGYNLRARLKAIKDDVKGAIADLDEALAIDPKDVNALLMRSRLHAADGNDAKAKEDVDQALRLRPELPEAIITRSMIAARNEKWADAIADMQILLQTDPTNNEYRLRLATYLSGDKRPRKAIELLTTIIDGIGSDADKDELEVRAEALRSRGDALLSVGKHAEAVKDYEEALKLEPDDTHVLNNYAWVLATSPDDGVRNAARSIELGLKACELTKYEKAHILSTLAAGYAEKGDWENAVKWSSKAVELGGAEAEVSDQLRKELERYKEKKPWREKQEIEENTKPLGKAKSDLET